MNHIVDTCQLTKLSVIFLIYIIRYAESLYCKNSKTASRPAMSVGVYIAWPQQTRTGFRSVFCAKSYKIKKNRPTARPSQQQQQRLCRLVTHIAGIYSDCSSREIVVCVWCAWYAVWSTRTLQAAEQLKCSSLVCVHRTEFLLHGGDRRWLASSDGRLPRLVPFKLHNLQLLNKILAHRPWALDHSLIAVSSLMIINKMY